MTQHEPRLPALQQHPQPAPPRLLGVDPGRRRTGIAISDELGMFAHPRPAIVESRPERVAEAIARLASAEHVSEVVVGLPLTMSGAESEQTASARAFARLLRKHCTVPVSAWDERLTSVQAERTVKGAANRKAGEVDSAAAVLILQAVLDARRTRVTP